MTVDPWARLGTTNCFARLVLVSWNGATAPPYAQPLPETGTVFRIVASGEGVIDAPVLLSPSDASTFDRAPRLFWNAPAGLRGDVEIATDAAFRSPAAFTPVYGGGGSATSMTVDAIDAGSYFWRVVLRSQKGGHDSQRRAALLGYPNDHVGPGRSNAPVADAALALTAPRQRTVAAALLPAALG